MQKVELAVYIAGYYAAWHEVDFSIMYDYTNDKLVRGDSKAEVDANIEAGFDDYGDTQRMNGIYDPEEDEYYVKL